MSFFLCFLGDSLFTHYEKRPFHYWVYTGSKDKPLYTSSFEEMLTLLDRETIQEQKKGIMKYTYLNWDKTKAKITIQETYTGDDSVGPSKSYIIVEKQQKGWTVVEYAKETNCLRGSSTNGMCL